MSVDPPRRAWLAFLLSLGAPGLGHLYTGSLAAAFGALAVACAGSGFGLFLSMLPSGSAWLGVLGLALVLATPLGIASHAARRGRSGRLLVASGSRRHACYLAWLIAVGLAAVEAGDAIRRELVQPLRASSAGMFPTLQVGDHFYANRRELRRREPRRGDVVVVELALGDDGIFPRDRRPDLPVASFVQRVVGLPGDVIALDGGVLHVDGKPAGVERRGDEVEPTSGRRQQILEEQVAGTRHAIARIPDAPGSDFGPIEIDAGRYFLLGDNRDNSYDSRHYGTVRREHVVAVATHLYFSRAPGGGVRWERIGLLVR